MSGDHCNLTLLLLNCRPPIPDPEYPCQPPMIPFKQFLASQDDSISEEEAVKRYNQYKLDFKKTQLNEYFLKHKDEEWWVCHNFLLIHLQIVLWKALLNYGIHAQCNVVCIYLHILCCLLCWTEWELTPRISQISSIHYHQHVCGFHTFNFRLTKWRTMSRLANIDTHSLVRGYITLSLVSLVKSMP